MCVECAGYVWDGVGGVHVDTCSCGNQIETILWSPAHSEASWPALPLSWIQEGGRERTGLQMAAYVMMMILYVPTLLWGMLLEAELCWSSVGPSGGHLRLCV